MRITWPQYDRCPEDFPLTGYTFSFDNASDPSRSNPVNPGAVSMDITLPAEGEATISYLANCSQLPSDSSDATTITVEPEPEPEPDTGTGTGTRPRRRGAARGGTGPVTG